MALKYLIVGVALAFGSVAASAAPVRSVIYHGLNDGASRIHAGSAVRGAHPGHFQRSDERHHSDERHRSDDQDHQDSGSGGYGS